MPDPDLLIIEERPDGIFLFGYTASGEFAGDTWHQTIDDAKAQATFWYGPDIHWSPIPADETDALAFAIRSIEGGR
jgi:hypothetical protein